MRHSLYLTVAVWLIKADLAREDRVWRKQVRKTAYQVPWDNPHLLRDIGLDYDGYPIGQEDRREGMPRAERHMVTIRRRWQLRIPT